MVYDSIDKLTLQNWALLDFFLKTEITMPESNLSVWERGADDLIYYLLSLQF